MILKRSGLNNKFCKFAITSKQDYTNSNLSYLYILDI